MRGNASVNKTWTEEKCKKYLNVGSFLLRRGSGVNAEMAVFSTCFNISRMMTLVDKKVLMQRLWNETVEY